MPETAQNKWDVYWRERGYALSGSRGRLFRGLADLVVSGAMRHIQTCSRCHNEMREEDERCQFCMLPVFKAPESLYQAPNCSSCGEIMVRHGERYKCLNCGSTSG